MLAVEVALGHLLLELVELVVEQMVCQPMALLPLELPTLAVVVVELLEILLIQAVQAVLASSFCLTP
jgi:hypothetical protein